MTRRILTVLLTAIALVGGAITSSTAAAAGTPDSSLPLRKSCQGNRGVVPGTNGIYSLRATRTSCRNARLVVKKFHTKRANSGRNTLRARGYLCMAHYTAGYEGLVVNCRRGSRRVTWTAYLDPSVLDRGRWSPPAGHRRCGTFKANVLRIHVYAKNISCRKARRIQKALWIGPESGRVSHNGGSGAYGWITLKKFPGWICRSGTGGGSCQKGNKSAFYLN